jgi:hypothetical protein
MRFMIPLFELDDFEPSQAIERSRELGLGTKRGAVRCPDPAPAAGTGGAR